MIPAIFNSRLPQYKTPYGAAVCGAEITLTLRLGKTEGLSTPSLCLFFEFANQRKDLPLTPAGEEEDCLLYTVSYTAPAEPDLLWYHFRLRQENGEALWLGKAGLTPEEEKITSWQQTVYDPSLPTPDWFGRGVTYQIFPDRFRRTALPDSSGIPGQRTLHPDWDEGLGFLGDLTGESPNRQYFGGNLAGIEEKLGYLHALGVNTLYLCPIFEADSSHRYNTGDYEKIDPMLGTEEDFRRLCEKAHALGIRIILDGVFNHTGSNSRYFNADGAYPAPGAAQSKESPYYPWYTFQEWPARYDAWWGIETLPAVNEMHPDYIDYIIEGENSIIRRWLRAGADAWRLDVADELPDEFIARIRRVMDEEKPGSVLLGEVWEDGSNKIAYDQRRRYLLGRETHGLMNYPFRVAALAYLTGGPAADFVEAMETIRENYPAPAFYSGMNLLGTHDTPRILTLLGTAPKDPPVGREELAAYRMTPQEQEKGLRLLRVGAILLYTFPGSPTVYYGDEAGVEGFQDPFNRSPFPWGREDVSLQQHYAALGKLRNQRLSLQIGALRWLCAQGQGLVFSRTYREETTAVLLNASGQPVTLTVPWEGEAASDALTGRQYSASGGELMVEVPPMEGILLI